MPLAWIHNLPREEAEKLAVELGVSVQGSLDELRKRLKDKWRALEAYLPPQVPDKLAPSIDVAGTTAVKILGGDVHTQTSYTQNKLRGNVISDLVKNIPALTEPEPEAVFHFLVRAKAVYDLKLVVDGDFLALLISRTAGKLMQTISVHLRIGSEWRAACADILSVFLPPRIRERLLMKYVLDRFQGPTEDLFHFVTSVVSAAEILEYQVSESALVRRIVQNLHPNVRSWLTFESEPKTVEELNLLATRVAEARLVEQVRGLERHVPIDKVSREESNRCPVSMVARESPRVNDRNVRCYKCERVGHIARNCLSSNVPRRGDLRRARANLGEGKPSEAPSA